MLHYIGLIQTLKKLLKASAGNNVTSKIWSVLCWGERKADPSQVLHMSYTNTLQWKLAEKRRGNTCSCDFQSENNIHRAVQKDLDHTHTHPFRCHMFLSWFSSWETHVIGTKKKKKSFSVIFQSDYLGSDLGKCLSIITPFPKHCLSAVWRVRSAEFLSEINRGKGNFSHLCGVITATTSFETNLFVASLLFKNWLIPNLLSWWNLTASQLELAQPI